MLKKTDYIYLGRYKNPLIYGWQLQHWVNNEMAKKYGLPLMDGRLAVLDGHVFIYKKDWDEVKAWTRKIVEEEDKKSFSAVFKLMDHEIKGHLRTATQLRKSKKLEPKAFAKFFLTLNHMEYPWFYVLPMSEELETIIREKIAASQLPEKYLQSFFTPAKPTLLIKQQREIVALKHALQKAGVLAEVVQLLPPKAMALLERKHANLHQKIIKHIAEYQWFGMMHMWGSPFSVDKFFEHLQTLPEKVKTEPEEVPLPASLTWLQEQTRQLVYWRNYVAEACGMGSYLALEKLEEACRQFGITYFELGAWLAPAELLQGLQGEAIPDQAELRERKHAYGTVVEDGGIHVITGKKLQQTITQMLDVLVATKELRGMVANPGKATGIVKVVLSPDEIDKVQPGDIMVASETTPDFVPAAHRAAALIADVGGITSHAAIISREMGHPCIVGTKIATQVLKDGDRVEVDADNGVVRILDK